MGSIILLIDDGAAKTRARVPASPLSDLNGARFALISRGLPKFAKCEWVLQQRRTCSLCATTGIRHLTAETKSFDICVENRQMFSRAELKSTTESESAGDAKKRIGADVSGEYDGGIALRWWMDRNSRRSCGTRIGVEDALSKDASFGASLTLHRRGVRPFIQ